MLGPPWAPDAAVPPTCTTQLAAPRVPFLGFLKSYQMRLLVFFVLQKLFLSILTVLVYIFNESVTVAAAPPVRAVVAACSIRPPPSKALHP